jgi:hypothetical protein
MKKFGLYLSLCLTLTGTMSYAEGLKCSDLFHEDFIARGAGSSQNGSDVIFDAFKMILNAPNNSTIKIYTKRLNNDDIGDLLLLVSVYESRKERGLKFEFYFEDSSGPHTIYQFLAESSANTIKFKDSVSTENEFSGKTYIEVVGKDESRFYQFRGDLTSVSLRNHGTVQVRKFAFKTIEDVLWVNSNLSDYFGNDFHNVIQPESYKNHYWETKMTLEHMKEINNGADHLASQLYKLKYGNPPPAPTIKENVKDKIVYDPTEVNILEVLKEAIAP